MDGSPESHMWESASALLNSMLEHVEVGPAKASAPDLQPAALLQLKSNSKIRMKIAERTVCR